MFMTIVGAQGTTEQIMNEQTVASRPQYPYTPYTPSSPLNGLRVKGICFFNLIGARPSGPGYGAKWRGTIGQTLDIC